MTQLKWIFLPLMVPLISGACTYRTGTRNIQPETPVSAATQILKWTTSTPGSTRDGEIIVKEGCIKSYADFAYDLQKWDQDRISEEILPLSPWKIEATVPTQQEDDGLTSIHVEIAREVDGKQEIWLLKQISTGKPGEGIKSEFLVYDPDLRDWEVISVDTGYKDIFVQDLFLGKDGSLWGQTVWDSINGKPDLRQAPVLSRFNESTRRFEFVPGVSEILMVPDQENNSRPKIVVDHQGIFWIFRGRDGIYRFDPETPKTEKQVDLPNIQVVRLALAPDGSIYFEKTDDEVYSKENFFHLLPGMIIQFIPETKSLTSVDLPRDYWPIPSGMMFDHAGRLWLGSIGYRDLDGRWRLIHPNLKKYFENAGDINQEPPRLMFESSNGVLWYQKFLDGDVRAEGTAWFNPQTGEGCVFSNLPVDIIEDTQQQLWSVADGKLYYCILII